MVTENNEDDKIKYRKLRMELLLHKIGEMADLDYSNWQNDRKDRGYHSADEEDRIDYDMWEKVADILLGDRGNNSMHWRDWWKGK